MGFPWALSPRPRTHKDWKQNHAGLGENHQTLFGDGSPRFLGESGDQPALAGPAHSETHCSRRPHAHFDFCQYGTRWRKRTTIMCWLTPVLPALLRKCSGKQGVCSSTGRPHIQLCGQDKVSHKLWTQIAEPYPARLCAAAAAAAAESLTHSFFITWNCMPWPALHDIA